MDLIAQYILIKKFIMILLINGKLNSDTKQGWDILIGIDPR